MKRRFLGLGHIALLGFGVLAAPAPAADALAPHPHRPIMMQIAEQRANSFDAGDFYATPEGVRRLLRLAGAKAIRFANESQKADVLDRLVAPGQPLDGCSVEIELAMGVTILKSTPPTRELELLQPAALEQALASARNVPGVRMANPVFIDPDTGLRLIPTEEVIIRLKEEIDPQTFFGSDWPRARRLAGTADQFILALSGAAAEQMLAEVSNRARDSRVKWIEPDFVAQSIHHLIPDDTYFPSQWHLNNTGQGGGTAGADVHGPEAWNLATGTGAIVAILDVGVQTSHPDLSPNLAYNAIELAGKPNRDDDGNGYKDDKNGWDFYGDDNSPDPKTAYDNHGTPVAGVAVARGNNGLGVAGAGLAGGLLPIRIGESPDDSGSFYSSASIMAAATYYSAGRTADGSGVWRGADILNLSFSSSPSLTFSDALSWAAASGRNGQGCPIFAATGNGASGFIQFTLSGFPAGTYTIKWEYAKDSSGSDGDDTVWLDSIAFPGGSVERFESDALPAGWTTGGNASWISIQDGVGGNHALSGWDGSGSRAVRAGAISDGQATYLQVTRTVGAGNLVFYAWVSSQQDSDFFNLYVDGTRYFHFSGVPAIATAIAYPASEASTIAVGASSDFDYRSDYSQYGIGLDLVAPSGGGRSNIYTTDRTGSGGYNAGDYDPDFSGTSSATPLAAGVAALLLSAKPGLTANEVRSILQATAEKIGGVTYIDGYNEYYGYGRINAYAAVRYAVNTPPTVSDILDQSTPEDTATPPIPFVVGDLETGPDALIISANSSNPTLAPNENILLGGAGTDRTVTVIPAADLSGDTTIAITVTDGDGGSAIESFVLHVTEVNDAPSFIKGADQAVLQNAPPQSIAGWATAISSGPASESAQTVAFLVTVDDPLLFAAGPAIMPDGTLTYTPAVEKAGVATVTVRLQDNGGTANGGVDTSAPQVFTITVQPRILGRYIFYNQSAWDGNEPSANPSDDSAIAPDKVALRAGSKATFANYTSYSRGINGIMVDIAELPGVPTAQDFLFKAGNTTDPTGWPAAPAPSTITVRTGAGANGSDRLTLIWPDNAVQKQWLQVTVLATPNTGLGAPDVFYFGNAVGECGNSTTDAKVDLLDQQMARANPHTIFNPAPIDDPCDYNRDKKVDLLDQNIARANPTTVFSALNLIDLSGIGGYSAMGEAPEAAVAAMGMADGVASAGATGSRAAGSGQSSSSLIEKGSLGIGRDGAGRIVIDFEGAQAGKHGLEVCEDLTRPEWRPAGFAPQVEKNGLRKRWMAEPSAQSRFYRVVERP